ncbi:MAG TPA: PQQ-binding-like beta-propeller repeat protein [Candidatus Baltobacteraceae bacterium]|nr:PQQ-binding-like beta-propeller repeat protein [Candidatus Baltobacteraceae bacterium]
MFSIVVAAAILCACSGHGQTPTTPGSNSPSTSPSPSSSPSPSPGPTSTSTTAATLDDWPLDEHDSARSGVSNEVAGTPGPLTLKQLWQTNLGDVADTSPIEWNGMLFVTVHNGTTYGLAASSGAKIWTFTTSGIKITTSEPAYDTGANELYAGGVDGKIHRLNPTTGAEDTSHGFPVTITLATATEKDASPLNVANGYVYAQTSGYNGDAPPYVGHVVAISTSTGQLHVFNSLCSSQTTLINPSTCNQSDSGLWSRAGPVVDPDPAMGGAVFAATGNGDYNPASGDYGDSMLELKPDMSSLLAYYAPANALLLQEEDLDLGSTSPALVPRQGTSNTPLMAVQGGKDQLLRLVDRSNLRGSAAVLQTISLDAKVYSAPAIYQAPGGPLYVYVGLPDGMYAYTLTTLGGLSQLTQVWKTNLSLGGEGTSAAVRAGVVYVAASGELEALDATTGAVLGSAPIGGVHWESPMIARGVVYVTDESHNLTAFQILPSAGAASGARVRH